MAANVPGGPPAWITAHTNLALFLVSLGLLGPNDRGDTLLEDAVAGAIIGEAVNGSEGAVIGAIGGAAISTLANSLDIPPEGLAVGAEMGHLHAYYSSIPEQYALLTLIAIHVFMTRFDNSHKLTLEEIIGLILLRQIPHQHDYLWAEMCQHYASNHPTVDVVVFIHANRNLLSQYGQQALNNIRYQQGGETLPLSRHPRVTSMTQSVQEGIPMAQSVQNTAQPPDWTLSSSPPPKHAGIGPAASFAEEDNIK